LEINAKAIEPSFFRIMTTGNDHSEVVLSFRKMENSSKSDLKKINDQEHSESKWSLVQE
jgi:hypothetical protein